MGSLHTNRGRKRGREARAGLGFTREGPLPDLLEAVEGPGATHVLVLELPEGVAGAYIARAGCPLLLVNGQQALSRQRFTLAHEFGHHWIGHGTVVDEQSAMSDYDHDPDEVEANTFAAEFLVPRDAVRAWAKAHVRGAVTLEDVLLLAGDYGVSAQAARYALEGADALSGGKRCRQLDAEIADGVHVELAQRLGLPLLEDGLADTAGRLPRIPSALRNSALGDLLAGEIGVDEMAQRIGRTPAATGEMLTELRIDQLLPAAL